MTCAQCGHEYPDATVWMIFHTVNPPADQAWCLWCAERFWIEIRAEREKRAGYVS